MASPVKPPSPKRQRSITYAHPIILVLVGLPGSGKSSFASNLVGRSPHRWARINQDTINKGKRGTRELCISAAKIALSRGCNVVIDRSNLTETQRKDFINLASSADPAPAALHCVFFNLPVKECGVRAAQRQGHEGGVQGPGAYRIVGMMQKELTNGGPPTMAEGFSSIMECVDNEDINAALDLWVPYSDNSGAAAGEVDNGFQVADEWERVRPKKKKKGGNGLQSLDKFFGQNKSEAQLQGEGIKNAEKSGTLEVVPSLYSNNKAGSSGINRTTPASKNASLVTGAAPMPPSIQAARRKEEVQPVSQPTATSTQPTNAFSYMMAAAKQQGTSPSPQKPTSRPGTNQHPPPQQQLRSRHNFGNSFALSALNRYLKDPEKLVGSGDDVLYYDDQCVAVVDKFPKARFHALVIARDQRLQGPMDLTGTDVELVRHMKVRLFD